MNEYEKNFFCNFIGISLDSFVIEDSYKYELNGIWVEGIKGFNHVSIKCLSQKYSTSNKTALQNKTKTTKQFFFAVYEDEVKAQDN